MIKPEIILLDSRNWLVLPDSMYECGYACICVGCVCVCLYVLCVLCIFLCVTMHVLCYAMMCVLCVCMCECGCGCMHATMFVLYVFVMCAFVSVDACML